MREAYIQAYLGPDGEGWLVLFYVDNAIVLRLKFSKRSFAETMVDAWKQGKVWC